VSIIENLRRLLKKRGKIWAFWAENGPRRENVKIAEFEKQALFDELRIGILLGD